MGHTSSTANGDIDFSTLSQPSGTNTTTTTQNNKKSTTLIGTQLGPINMILFGTDGVGKTMFYNHLKELYGQGWKPFDDKTIQEISIHYIGSTILSIIQYGIDELKREVSLDNQDAYSTISSIDWDLPLSDFEHICTIDNGNLILKLWHDSLVQDIFNNHSDVLFINDQFPRLMSLCTNIFDPSYEITLNDFQYLYTPTQGRECGRITYDNDYIEVSDAGGRVDERMSWPLLMCTSKRVCTYMFSCIDYNKKCQHDPTLNKWTDSMQNFTHFVNGESFVAKKLIILLNRGGDELAAKLQLYPYPQFQPDYTDDNEYKQVYIHIKDQIQQAIPAEIECLFIDIDTKDPESCKNAMKLIAGFYRG